MNSNKYIIITQYKPTGYEPESMAWSAHDDDAPEVGCFHGRSEYEAAMLCLDNIMKRRGL